MEVKFKQVVGNEVEHSTLHSFTSDSIDIPLLLYIVFLSTNQEIGWEDLLQNALSGMLNFNSTNLSKLICLTDRFYLVTAGLVLSQ